MDASPDAAVPAHGRWRRLSRLAGWAASLVVFAAALLPLRDRWDAVGDVGGLPGLLPSVAALALNLGANWVLAGAWGRIVALTGTRLDPAAARWVWSVSQLARYTIGAAQLAGRAVVGRRYGVPVSAGVVTTLVEVGWQTSLTAALLLATLPWWLPGSGQLEWLALVALAPVAVLAAGLAYPDGLLRALARLLAAVPLRRWPRERLLAAAGRVSLSRGDAAAITGRFALNTGLRLAAFLLLVGAVGGDLATVGLLSVGAYAAGQIVGRLAVFAPGGIGPREGVSALVLATALGGGPALVVVAATRLLEILAELAFAVLVRWRRGPARGRAGRRGPARGRARRRAPGGTGASGDPSDHA